MKRTIKKMEKKKPVRYGVVSTASTWLDIGLYALLTWWGLPTLAANFLSTSAGFCLSFFVNRSYTFDSTDASVKRQILLFTIITLFGLWVIQPCVIYLFEYFYDGSMTWLISLIAKITATPVTMVYNYFLYAKVVFKDKKKDSDESN